MAGGAVCYTEVAENLQEALLAQAGVIDGGVVVAAQKVVGSFANDAAILLAREKGEHFCYGNIGEGEERNDDIGQYGRDTLRAEKRGCGSSVFAGEAEAMSPVVHVSVFFDDGGDGFDLCAGRFVEFGGRYDL